MPSKHLLEYLENQNINIDNLLTNQDSMVNLDSELEKMETPDTEEVPTVKPVALEPVNNIGEQAPQPINLEMPKEAVVQPQPVAVTNSEVTVTPQVVPVVPEVSQNTQGITPMNNNGVVNQTPNIPNQVVSEVVSSPQPVVQNIPQMPVQNVATVQTVSPVPEQNIPFPSEVL